LLDVLVLLNQFQTVVEKEDFAARLCHVALQADLCLVVAVRVECAEVPRQAGAHHTVPRPVVRHHVVKHIVAGITIEARGEERKPGPQSSVEQSFLRIGQTELGIDGLEFGPCSGGRGADEVCEGKWSCERANLTIENNGEGIFHATIKWGSSASSHVEWDYPLIFDGEKLVCEGTGTKTYVEYADAESEPSKTVEYTNGSAEFRLEGAGIVWDDLSENSGAGMIFKLSSDF